MAQILHGLSPSGNTGPSWISGELTEWFDKQHKYARSVPLPDGVGDHVLVAAIGIDGAGDKHVLAPAGRP